MTTAQTVSIIHPEKLTPISAIPKVELAGMHVVVNGKRHSLSRKGRAYRLIRAFFSATKPAMSSDDLIKVLHAEEGFTGELSDRAKACRHSALVRMMSRVREEFNATFEEITPKGMSWFHYDRSKAKWVLFKMPAAGADGLVY
jgi:hypothetical protein